MMNISLGNIANAVNAARLGQQIATAVTGKVAQAQEQQGEQALALLASAMADATKAQTSTVGADGRLDVTG